MNSQIDYKATESSNLLSVNLQQLFSGIEKPNNIISLLSVLVTLIHVYILISLLTPEETITAAVPMPMEVSLINVATPKPVTAPTPMAKPVTRQLVKPVQQAVIKKPSPVVQKSPEYAPRSESTTPPVSSEPVNSSASASSQEASSAPPAPAFVEANFKANYLHNPKPEYPAIAKSRGWQGKVLLRVQVSAEGTALQVNVDTSSGHEMLDESAMEAVNRWKFIPAKRGETAVASTVLVPIIFTLRE